MGYFVTAYDPARAEAGQRLNSTALVMVGLADARGQPFDHIDTGRKLDLLVAGSLTTLTGDALRSPASMRTSTPSIAVLAEPRQCVLLRCSRSCHVVLCRVLGQRCSGLWDHGQPVACGWTRLAARR